MSRSSTWLFLILSFFSLAESFFLKGREKHTTENASLSCQKYILLTTQRSGSTWTCNLFDMQGEFTCGGTELNQIHLRKTELMIKYSCLNEAENAAVEWSNYEKNLSNAIQNSVDTNDSCNPSTSSSRVGTVHAASGFKLMYDQIPQQFIDNNKIFDYFVKNDIAIIHLIREAKILRISSLKQSQGMPGNQPHTADKSVVQSLRKRTELISWDETTIQKVFQEEETDAEWQRLLLSSPKVKYHKLIYESMLEKEERKYQLDLVFEFLNVNHQDSEIKLDSPFLKLHNSTCEGRIDRYEEFREKIAGTKTLAVCEKLDEMFGDEEAEED